VPTNIIADPEVREGDDAKARRAMARDARATRGGA